MICNGLNITHFLWRLRHQLSARYSLNNQLLDNIYIADSSHCVLIPSHNNHIGHFFGDDLPMYVSFPRPVIVPLP